MDSDITGENMGEAWKSHCRKAARKFLMNAVVIDNMPVVESKREDTKKTSPKIARKVDDGMEGPVTEERGEKGSHRGKDTTPPPEKKKQDIEQDQKLDIREISDAFAHEHIVCAFVLPDDNDPDEDLIFKRIVNAALQSDIIVIDWYLRNTDPILTKKILTHIAEQDSNENGRLRVICVYTGQPDISEVTRLAAKALEEGGLEAEKTLPEKGIASSKHHCLLVLNKQSVVTKKLPNAIIDAFAELSEGLLPSFALASVAAVRRNMHHIITRFSKNLDAAYVANRLITNPPGDVAELIRQLFISECDTALGLERVADNYLEPEAIKMWLRYHNQPKDDSCEYKNKMKVDRAFLYALLENGITDDDKNVIFEVDKTDKFIKEKRSLISKALHAGKEEAIVGESLFSRHVVLKREFFGNTKTQSGANWVPSLTVGSILRQTLSHKVENQKTIKYKYFYCLTPACDTIRLRNKTRKFLMLELKEEDKKTNLIIMEENTRLKPLFVEPKPKNVDYFLFRGCSETGRVLAERKVLNTYWTYWPNKGEKAVKDVFVFKSEDEKPIELMWLGEVRRNRANRDMADLNRQWLRLGINDSEYLRLAGEGKAPFK